MTSSQATLTHQECQPFFNFYLDGIMNVGLLQPLESFAKSNVTALGRAVRTWYDLQIRGETPQAAITKTYPRFPLSIEKLLVLGLEKSVLDIVLSDIIGVYKNSVVSGDEIEKALAELQGKHSKLNTEVICSDCWHGELSKVISRSKLEGATKVILEQEDDLYLHQRYVSAKLVVVSESSIAAVHKTLLHTLTESASTGKDLVLDQGAFKIQKISDLEFRMIGPKNELDIIFSYYSSKLLHITSQAEWQKAQQQGFYEAPSLQKEGFIHCSLRHQVTRVANSIFKNQQDLILLEIDEAKLQHPVIFEDLYKLNALYPHIYGPIHTDAVIRTIPFPCQADGTFTLPKKMAL